MFENDPPGKEPFVWSLLISVGIVASFEINQQQAVVIYETRRTCRSHSVGLIAAIYLLTSQVVGATHLPLWWNVSWNLGLIKTFTGKAWYQAATWTLRSSLLWLDLVCPLSSCFVWRTVVVVTRFTCAFWHIRPIRNLLRRFIWNMWLDFGELFSLNLKTTAFCYISSQSSFKIKSICHSVSLICKFLLHKIRLWVRIKRLSRTFEGHHCHQSIVTHTTPSCELRNENHFALSPGCKKNDKIKHLILIYSKVLEFFGHCEEDCCHAKAQYWILEDHDAPFGWFTKVFSKFHRFL